MIDSFLLAWLVMSRYAVNGFALLTFIRERNCSSRAMFSKKLPMNQKRVASVGQGVKEIKIIEY